ncbi:MAG: VOC family protein [Chloroflexi bacterium]|nr:VOC family protein [Chloroflexota bacterium]
MSDDANPAAREWPDGVHAITLFVDDLGAAKRFYSAVFRVPMTFEDENSAVFDFGNLIVNLLHEDAAVELIGPARVADAAAGARLQLTINVADADAACADLARRGVTLVNGPLDRPWGVRTAAFRDPGGHVWEVASLRRPRR